MTLKILLTHLTNISLNFIRHLRGIITYPISIIPRKSYKHRFEIDDIEDLEGYFLIRRCSKTYSETFDKNGILREASLIERLEEIPGCSMNLYKPVFQPNHISFLPKKPAYLSWDKLKDKFLWIKYIWKVRHISPTTPIFVKLHLIHNKHYPYNNVQNKHTEALKRNLDESKLSQENSFTMFIKHEPTKLNYWHVEFNIHLSHREEKDLAKKDIKEKNLVSQENAGFANSTWSNQIVQKAFMHLKSASICEEFLGNAKTIHKNVYSA
jgi:hypothetical protein